MTGARVIRVTLGVAAAVAAWQVLVWATGLPRFLLPGPGAVARALVAHRGELRGALGHTLSETLIGLILGVALGAAIAVTMQMAPRVGRTLAPMLIVSQTIPVFALAPILTLWLGFGIAPKIAIVVLIVFVPVAQALYDGLAAPPPAQLDVARAMGAGRWTELRRLRLPAALPRLASGIRLGTIYAPIGAVIGEWVGGARGLGALMIQANGRMKTDLMFAALFVVVAMSLAIYRLVDGAMRRGWRRYGV